MMTDPIGDFLARIRNTLMMKRPQVKVLRSKMAVSLAEILQREGFVAGFDAPTSVSEREFTIHLKYDASGAPLISDLKRVSKPGLRVYVGSGELPSVRGGQGIAVVSTSKGVMTSADAKEQKVGGEVLCYVW
jgi:small subunit ribosomal protein S8